MTPETTPSPPEEEPPKKAPARALTVDQYYLHKFGLSRDGTELKIGDFDMFGVPVTLALSTGRFLFVLSPREQHLFREYVDSPVRLFLRTRANRDEKADLKIILMNGKLTAIENLAQNENLCLLTIRYLHSPEEYSERIQSFFYNADYLREKYKQSQASGDSAVPFANLPLDTLNQHAVVRFPDGSKRRARIQALASSAIELFLEASEGEINADTALAVELHFQGFSIFLKSSGKACRASAEVSGFAFATLSLSFHPAVVELVGMAAPAAPAAPVAPVK